MNNLWLDIWQECRRITSRNTLRVKAWRVARRIHQSERILGELGWQQAHFDASDAFASELASSEKEQARLLFEIAEGKEDLTQLEASFLEKITFIRKQIEEAELSRERAETQAIQLHTAIAAEKERHTATYLIDNLEKSLAQEEARLRVAARACQPLHATFSMLEKTSRQEIAGRQKALKKLEIRLSHLQQKKPTQFAKIGRELADAGIGPLNQPETLARVLTLREHLAGCQLLLAKSLTPSRLLPWPGRLAAYALTMLMAFTLGLGLFLIASLGLALVRR